MRLTQLAGIALIIGGALLLWLRPTYPTRQDVVRIGEFKASMRQEESVPPWIGGVGIGLGVILLVAGAKRRG